MFKTITMCDSNYFVVGELFLKTRYRVNADFVLYGPDLNKEQINILKKHDIEYIKVDENIYKTQMQFLKFGFIAEQIEFDHSKKYDGFTLVDFDTFFINDWSHVFKYNFDYGVTIRNKMLNRRCFRSYTNGGVVFAKHNSIGLIRYAENVIRTGKDKGLPEYDTIWKTLEIGRPAHKTHSRKVLRWWNDQVLNSALVLKYFNENGYHKIRFEPTIFNFQKYKIGMFTCDNYNVVESKPNIKITKNIYIRHLKTTGRNILGINKTQEKLNF